MQGFSADGFQQCICGGSVFRELKQNLTIGQSHEI